MIKASGGKMINTMNAHNTYKIIGSDSQTSAYISVAGVSDDNVSRMMEEKYGWMREARKELLEMMKAMKPNECYTSLRR